MARRSFSSGVIGLSPFGGGLADENVAGLHLGADIDDARFVEILQRLFRDVGNIAGDFLGAELGVARHHLEFIDMDRGEDVFLHDALVEEDRVFEVVAVPRHEGDEHVAAERQIAEVRRGAVSDDVALLHQIADANERLLVDAGRLVRALELHQTINVDARLGRVLLFCRANDDARRIDLIDDAGAARGDGGARVGGDDRLHAGADERRVRLDQRHGLALHVGAHQRAVGVVILQEGNERRGDRDELLGRHVHGVDALARDEHDIAGVAAEHQILGEIAFRIDRGVGLGDVIFLLLHGGEIGDLIRHLAVAHAAIRAFDEAVFVHARKGGERIDEADVRTFRRLDRTDTAVMRRMHVAHLEARRARASDRPGPAPRDGAYG
jgi:hypothetical protein